MVKAAGAALTQRIVENARRSFSAIGYADTTVKDVAAACATTPRSVLRRFPTKNDLLIAVARTVGNDITADLTGLDLCDIADPLDRLHKTMALLFSKQTTDRDQIRLLLLFAGEAHRVPELAKAMRSAEDDWESRLVAIIHDAQDKEHFKGHDAATLAAALIAIFVSYPAILRVLGVSKLSKNQELDDYFKNAWKMIVTMC